MPIYRPSELIQYLEQIGAYPKKGLSQNFLIDNNILKKILRLAELSSEDTVLEIGPGPGALSELIIEKGASLIAVEKDELFAKGLERLKKQNVSLFCADILQFPVEEQLEKHLSKGKKAKVMANLPYNIATPIITHLVTLNQWISQMVVMVQEEVARRFVAHPGTKEYGSLSIFLQYYSQPKYGFRVSHNCFYPKPNVESAIVSFKLKTPKEEIDEEKFFPFVQTAFQQRRKTLRNSLKKFYSPEQLEETLLKLGHSPKARPEELSLQDFMCLFKGRTFA